MDLKGRSRTENPVDKQKPMEKVDRILENFDFNSNSIDRH